MRQQSFSRISRVALGLLFVAAGGPMVHAQEPAAPATGAATDGQEAQPIEKFDLTQAVVHDGGGLTAAEAGKRARSRSPRIAAARAAAASTGWDAETQWAAFLPQVQAYGQYKRVNLVKNNISLVQTPTAEQWASFTPATRDVLPDLKSMSDSQSGSSAFTAPVDQYALGASLKYPVSDIFLRVWPAYKASRTLVDSQAVQIEVAESLVDIEARLAFYEYARARAQYVVAEQAVAQAEAQAAQIKLFVDAGTVAPVDALTATARLEQARGAAARARGMLAVGRSRLATLMGAKLEEVSDIAEPVLELPRPEARDVDSLTVRAIERRPELRALRKLVNANERMQVAQARSALPQLVIDASDLYAQPNPRHIPPNRTEFYNTWEVGGSIVWSPNSTLTGYQAGRKADAVTAKARADLATQEDNVRIEVVQAYEDLKSAIAVAHAAEAQLVAAEEAYRVRLAMYRVGAGVIIDLLNADFALTQARLDHANAAIGARSAHATLERVAVLRDE